MTCIVGVSDNNNVYIGGDRGISDNDIILSMSRPKITKHGDWIFGFSGSPGTGQLTDFINLPRVLKNDDPYSLIKSSIVPEIKKAYDSLGRDIEDNGTDWLIGCKGRLFEMSSGDWGVLEVKESSIGTGSPIALGSLYSTRNRKDHVKRITLALNAAIELSTTCHGPIDIISL